MRFKKAVSTMLVTGLIMGMNVIANAEEVPSTSVTEPGGVTESEVVLASKDAIFDVVVPISLYIDAQANGSGKQLHKIINNSSACVNIDSVTLIENDDWYFINGTKTVSKDKNGFDLTECVEAYRYNLIIDSGFPTHADGYTLFNSTEFDDNKKQSGIYNGGSSGGFNYVVDFSPTLKANTTELCKLEYTFSWYIGVL